MVFSIVIIDTNYTVYSTVLNELGFNANDVVSQETG